MSKIICEVCGTSYADTANQCPICGTVRPTEAQSVNDDGAASEYTYVKGGRFSKGNVRRRNTGREYTDGDRSSGAKIGLLVVLIALILVVIAIATYVVITLVGGSNTPETDPTPTQAVTNPCQAIVLPQKEIHLENIGDTMLLNARKSPVNSTDELSFESSDTEVVTVDAQGLIEAVGEGSAVITITCGNVETECHITVGSTEVEQTLQLNRQVITFTEQGDTWQFFAGDIAVEDIEWSSDDESVALVSGGLVVAVGEGETIVHAMYGELTATCIVKCDFNAENPGQSGGIGEDIGDLGGSGGVGEDIGGSVTTEKLVMQTNYGSMYYNDYYNAYDVTIRVGDQLTFYLKSGDRTLTGVSWSIPEGTTCCTLNSNVINAVSSGEIYLTAAYNGQTVKCIIRIS
jgi:hypothetical protein